MRKERGDRLLGAKIEWLTQLGVQLHPHKSPRHRAGQPEWLLADRDDPEAGTVREQLDERARGA